MPGTSISRLRPCTAGARNARSNRPGWLRGGRSRRRRADGCQRSYRHGSRSRPPSRSRAPPCAALSLRAVDCVASNPAVRKPASRGFEALPLTFASVRRNQSRLVQWLKTILETADANVGSASPVESSPIIAVHAWCTRAIFVVFSGSAPADSGTNMAMTEKTPANLGRDQPHFDLLGLQVTAPVR